jgi:Tol biopolymer transport system component
LAWVDLRPKPPPPSSAAFEIQPPAGEIIGDAALSPDGKQLALIVGSYRRAKLLIRNLDDPALRPVPGAEPTLAQSLHWSPDGRKVAFAQSSRIRTFDLGNGSIADLCSADSPAVQDWGTDGMVLFSAAEADGKRRIFEVPAASGTPQPLFALDAARQETVQDLARFLPGGKRILYYSEDRKERGIYVASLDGSLRKFLHRSEMALYLEHPRNRKSYLFLDTATGGLLQQFDPNALALVGDPIAIPRPIDNNLRQDAVPSALLYGETPMPRNRLAWFSRSGKELETVAETDSYFSHDLSADDRHVVWEVLTEPHRWGDLWVKDLERGTKWRLASDPGWKWVPRFWPDGNKIAFTWFRPQTQRFDLILKAANGSGSEQLVSETGVYSGLDDVSPDGAFLLYTQYSPPRSLWVLPLAGDRRPILYRSGKGQNWAGKFSPDGRWIAYASHDSGRPEIYVQDFQPAAAGGPPTHGILTPVSSEGGIYPRWSADGKELFYLDHDNNLMAVPVKTGGQFSAGRPEKLFRLTTGHYRIPYVPSADGRRFLIAAPESSTPESNKVVVVTNWMEALVH